ncbi:MAG TPA: hypothetical protein PK563_12245 [Tenuifilaceae bacterium]|nr:hypothetical protein [Tenuifilaceae bacterium]
MVAIGKLLEDYIDSNISAGNSELLKAKLRINTLLAKELAFRRELNDLFLEEDIARLRSRLFQAQISQRSYSKPDAYNNSYRIKRVLMAAAAITGIAFGSWWAVDKLVNATTKDKLLSENINLFPPIMAYRDAVTNELFSQIQKSVSYYQKGDFTIAAIHFELLLINNPSSNMLKVYLGITYLQLNEFSKAHELFNEVEIGHSLFADQAIWYNGLTYLAESDFDNATKCFKKLAEKGGELGKRANHLIKEMKKIQVN